MISHFLTRTWLRAVLGQPDLGEAQQIDERIPLRLHLADIHRHRARHFGDIEELKHASALIDQCGYWHRKQELEGAVKASISW